MNGFSPECVFFKITWIGKRFKTFFTSKWLLRWVLSWDDWENDLKHSLQINGFSLEWVLRCALRLSDAEKALEQSLQRNGCPLYWMCSNVSIKILNPESENDLKHSLQVNGLSPEWVLRWVLSSDDWENDLEHSLQVNGFSPERVLRWVLSSCFNVVIKIAWIGKWFKTFFTSKWPLSRMGS